MKCYSSNTSSNLFTLTEGDSGSCIEKPSLLSRSATEETQKSSHLSIPLLRTTSSNGKLNSETDVHGKEREQVKRKETAVCLMPSVTPITDKADNRSSTVEPNEVLYPNASRRPASRREKEADGKDRGRWGLHPQAAEGTLSGVSLPPLHRCPSAEREEAKTKDLKNGTATCHVAPQCIPIYIGEYVHSPSLSHKRPQRHGKGCYLLVDVEHLTTMARENEQREVCFTWTSLNAVTAAWDGILTPSIPSLSPLALPDGVHTKGHSSSLLQVEENLVGTPFVPQPTSRIDSLLFYKGVWARDALHGQGVAVFTDGTHYVGSFSHDKKHGKGVLFYPAPDEKAVSSMFFLSSTLPSSASSFPYSHAYQGEFENDLKHGKGKEYFSSGAVYEGQYWRGYRSGKGGMLFSDGATRYEGQWRYNRFHGYGRLEYGNGDLYEGYFKEGKRHGEGKAVFAQTGSTYEGGWYHDEPHAHACNVLLFRFNEEKKRVLTPYNGYAWNGKMVCQRQHIPRVFSFDKKKKRISSETEVQEEEEVSENSLNNEKMHRGDSIATFSSFETKLEPQMDEKALYF